MKTYLWMTALQLCKGTLALFLIFGSISRGFGFVIVFGDSGFFSVCDYGTVGEGITEDTRVILFPVNTYPLDLVYNFFSLSRIWQCLPHVAGISWSLAGYM